MHKSKLNLRKKIGFILLAIVIAYWLVFPIIPFLDIPHKALIMTAMAIGGEILLLIVITLLGKEYWTKIKNGFKHLLTPFKSQNRKSDH
ncbi:transporter suffix domain-containing protein [Acinetobacter gyllenbergii]|uniref:transporter suffix domain-containing protein n=1 Tax=Acinetobacter gyllenbergii TaxID=134534 RepID=UPI003F5742D9